MKIKQTYSLAFREQALAKVFSRGSRTIGSVADELNMHAGTLKNWMKEEKALSRGEAAGEARRPEDWSAEERLLALQQSHGLVGETLNAWCRERGLFAHQLTQWREDFCTVSSSSHRRESAQEVRELKSANVQLQRELTRKDRALAEAAALLVLSKKYQALFGDEAS